MTSSKPLSMILVLQATKVVSVWLQPLVCDGFVLGRLVFLLFSPLVSFATRQNHKQLMRQEREAIGETSG